MMILPAEPAPEAKARSRFSFLPPGPNPPNSAPNPAATSVSVGPDDRFVYFVRAAGLPVAKIGVSADPGERLSGMRVGSPIKLHIAGAKDA